MASSENKDSDYQKDEEQNSPSDIISDNLTILAPQSIDNLGTVGESLTQQDEEQKSPSDIISDNLTILAPQSLDTLGTVGESLTQQDEKQKSPSDTVSDNLTILASQSIVGESLTQTVENYSEGKHFQESGENKIKLEIIQETQTSETKSESEELLKNYSDIQISTSISNEQLVGTESNSEEFSNKESMQSDVSSLHSEILPHTIVNETPSCENRNDFKPHKRINESKCNTVKEKKSRYSGFSMASTLKLLDSSNDKADRNKSENYDIKEDIFIEPQDTPVLEETKQLPIEPENTDTEIKQEAIEYSISAVDSLDQSYNLEQTSVPIFLAQAKKEFQSMECENYLRGCKWSPDGSSIVVNCNDNKMRLFHLDHIQESKMPLSLTMKEGSQIYDFSWLPQTTDSNTKKIVCTCSGIPAHLWNCNTGKVEATYKAFDQYDEVTAAYSLSFSTDGQKLYAGYERTIRVFNTEYPNKYCRTTKTFDSKNKEGQTGIISCFAMSPEFNGVYVAGSYSRHIGIYDSGSDKLVCLMQGQRGGVTHLMFSPDGTKLYSGGRKDPEIICWDLRNTGKILFSVLRDVKTNQRMYFDITESGRYLTSGNHDGSVTFWDTISANLEEINGEMFLKPSSQFQAHGDCVNGVSFNHKKGLLATASGQRHFENFLSYNSDDSDCDSVDIVEKDFALKLWTLPTFSNQI